MLQIAGHQIVRHAPEACFPCDLGCASRLLRDLQELTDLVKVLREQHEAGRRVTDVILRNAVGGRFGKEDARKELVAACRGFIRMYRPQRGP